jgi:3-deoxy-7-phosphoheptulonate synthase
MPVGFKNTVSGDVVAAVNATIVAARPNQFIGTNEQGKTSIVKTSGNPHCHIILRGSSNKTNYDIFSMKQAQHLLLERGLAQKILIDCSHGNASQSHSNQVEVINSLMNVVKNKQGPILGFMLESHLFEGRQDILRHGLPSILRYGQSLTDACLGWNETESTLLRVFNEA